MTKTGGKTMMTKTGGKNHDVQPVPVMYDSKPPQKSGHEHIANPAG